MPRNFSDIAQEIESNWTKVNYAARPYLDAMKELETSDPNAPYFMDDARTIVLYFLNNATSWRGEKAREIKKELNQMVKR